MKNSFSSAVKTPSATNFLFFEIIAADAILVRFKWCAEETSNPASWRFSRRRETAFLNGHVSITQARRRLACARTSTCSFSSAVVQVSGANAAGRRL